MSVIINTIIKSCDEDAREAAYPESRRLVKADIQASPCHHFRAESVKSTVILSVKLR